MKKTRDRRLEEACTVPPPRTVVRQKKAREIMEWLKGERHFPVWDDTSEFGLGEGIEWRAGGSLPYRSGQPGGCDEIGCRLPLGFSLGTLRNFNVASIFNFYRLIVIHQKKVRLKHHGRLPSFLRILVFVSVDMSQISPICFMSSANG